MKILSTISAWWRVGALYLGAMLIGNVTWETAQLPLYAFWETGTPAYLAFSVVHCSGGDLMIGASALLAAAMLVGRDGPAQNYGRVACLTIVFGVVYTVFSEWLNVTVRGRWAYAADMPVAPILGTGLSPILQWIIVPGISFIWARTQKLFAPPWAIPPNAD